MRPVGYAALLAVPVALYMAFVYAPTEAFMGDAQRIMYIHVPSAQAAYLAFVVVFAASILYLRRRSSRWDALAHAAAEVGVVFTTATLITGSVWARKVWGWWWTWDPRLTTTLVLWFIYTAYLVLRRAVDDPERRGRFAAVFGIIGFLDVPVVHLSVEWWRSIHPPNISPGGTELHPDMTAALIVASVAVFFVNVLLIWMRYRVEVLEQAVARALAASDAAATGPRPGAEVAR